MVNKKDHPPADPTVWTEADWKELYDAIEAVRRKVAERHQKRLCPVCRQPTDIPDRSVCKRCVN